MNKDQKLLEEAYQSIYENTREPLYFGPPKIKQGCLNWLRTIDSEVHEDGSVSVNGDVKFINNAINGNSGIVGNYLNKIPFKFRKVTGDFVCSNCDFTSLEGAPQEVGGNVYLPFIKFKSLKGGPEKVRGDFRCSDDLQRHTLTSLEGAPEFIGGEFWSDEFSDEDYRSFAKNKNKERRINTELSKDFSEEDLEALKDF
jgi:hypothetical protein